MAQPGNSSRAFSEGAQGFDVQIVGRFIQQQHVAAGLQQLGQVQTATFTTGEFADRFCWSAALKLKRPM